MSNILAGHCNGELHIFEDWGRGSDSRSLGFFPNCHGESQPSPQGAQSELWTIPRATDAKCPLQTHDRGIPLSPREAAVCEGPRRPHRLHICSRAGCVSELAVICNLNISFVREQFRKEENKLQARGPQQRCRGTVCTPRPRARVHTAHL